MFSCRPVFVKLPVHPYTTMLNSFYPVKQIVRNSPATGWQPEPAAPFVCLPGGCWERQQTGQQNIDTNFICSMKNPRKSPGNLVGFSPRVVDNLQQQRADLPVITEPDTDILPESQHSPEEESFRTFLHARLPRHKAPQALRERIKQSIKNMPD